MCRYICTVVYLFRKPRAGLAPSVRTRACMMHARMYIQGPACMRAENIESGLPCRVVVVCVVTAACVSVTTKRPKPTSTTTALTHSLLQSYYTYHTVQRTVCCWLHVQYTHLVRTSISISGRAARMQPRARAHRSRVLVRTTVVVRTYRPVRACGVRAAALRPCSVCTCICDDA